MAVSRMTDGGEKSHTDIQAPSRIHDSNRVVTGIGQRMIKYNLHPLNIRRQKWC